MQLCISKQSIIAGLFSNTVALVWKPAGYCLVTWPLRDGKYFDDSSVPSGDPVVLVNTSCFVQRQNNCFLKIELKAKSFSDDNRFVSRFPVWQKHCLFCSSQGTTKACSNISQPF